MQYGKHENEEQPEFKDRITDTLLSFHSFVIEAT